ncbi:hypothetical protein EJF36_17620 [Bacillus sp. HMF5848]|uniref:sugar-binding transcriptional regulator n=1 Tax=Bacillus sp. HMF5848 TaxID=2495421 RepID=UPI000F79D9AB|nr:sugar-binding domain-containing protein [Bacillus sp. HMF5848]RSK28538.1 hypothetical protein EJF36_17620 [Bacillus sp. HMF5848]
MKAILDIQKKLLPDLLAVMQKRYQILQHIRLMQPIGRRTLATSLGISERVLRGEVEFLKSQHLLLVESAGMSLTGEGRHVLRELDDLMKEIMGIKQLEIRLKAMLQLKQVIVVPGNSDDSVLVKHEMGRACVALMKKLSPPSSIVSVTGGTTMAAVADKMTPDSNLKNLLFVPARGALGEIVEIQANTICAKMAEQANGQYKLLHVPDQLSNEAYQSIIQVPSVKDVLQLISDSTMIVHGIGEAFSMAERRKTADDVMKIIKDKQAVAEAFGYYFDESGKVVHKVQTIGIQLADLENIKYVIAIAGGASKAKAIRAYMKQAPDTYLITDEGAAKQLLAAM